MPTSRPSASTSGPPEKPGRAPGSQAMSPGPNAGMSARGATTLPWASCTLPGRPSLGVDPGGAHPRAARPGRVAGRRRRQEALRHAQQREVHARRQRDHRRAGPPAARRRRDHHDSVAGGEPLHHVPVRHRDAVGDQERRADDRAVQHHRVQVERVRLARSPHVRSGGEPDQRPHERQHDPPPQARAHGAAGPPTVCHLHPPPTPHPHARRSPGHQTPRPCESPEDGRPKCLKSSVKAGPPPAAEQLG